MQRWITHTAAALVAAAIFTAPAWGKDDKKDGGKKGNGLGPKAEAVFKKKDTDGDGKLTLAEFTAGIPENRKAKAETRFKKLDKDTDGFVTVEELKSGWAASKEKGKDKDKDEDGEE